MKIQFSDMKNMNVPRYCRKTMKTGNFPEILEIYRGEMLCLTVDVVKASKLRLIENEKEGPLYKKYYDSGFMGSPACNVQTTDAFKFKDGGKVA